MGADFYPDRVEEGTLAKRVPTLYYDGIRYRGTWLDVLIAKRSGYELKIERGADLRAFLAKRKSLISRNPAIPLGWLAKGKKLRTYQEEGIAALLLRGRLLLADGAGLGKTLISLGAFACLRTVRKSARLVVFCPPSIRRQWADEVERFIDHKLIDPDTDVAVVDGSAEVRREIMRKRRPITIMNYECITNDMRMRGSSMSGAVVDCIAGATMLVWDDATDRRGLRNPRTKTSARARGLTAGVPIVLVTSATPIERGLENIYGIYSVLDPDLFPSLDAFKDTYLRWEEHVVWVKPKRLRGKKVPMRIRKQVGTKNIPHLKRIIKHRLLRRTPEEVGEQLPKLIAVPVWVDMSEKSKAIYEGIKASAYKSEASSKILSWISKARQFCLDPDLAGYSEPSVKSEKIMELLDGPLVDDSVIIFTDFRRYAMKLKELLGRRAGVIVGGISTQQRYMMQQLFQQGKLKILICDEAMERGGNLQRASVVLNADLPFLPSNLVQRVGRARRIAATHNKIRVISVLCRGTYEEKILEFLEERSIVFDELLTEGKSPFKGMTIREMRRYL